MQEKTQVLVIDCGPAKSTAPALLARQGVDVTVLAREHFPRYQVGESLLPSLVSVPDVMGVKRLVEQHEFVRKTTTRSSSSDHVHGCGVRLDAERVAGWDGLSGRSGDAES
ncbi:hypothetical protein BFF78_00970 [Streptomyces fodineus]|uniref:FAD-binding domain-containing protein n=1 Tax=Streptomyces fodineus TaxID=1904616 RepID=A0A1D7Y2Q0_9ACTN|nr:tryptophan 7-halogenase [Streptomyces fodineus]AOR29843.1 hypothetical protein BFF78_00970 [Streptomyces fodineus]